MRTELGRLGDTPPAAKGPRTVRPELFVGQLEARLGTAVGLSQFGVNHLTLEPGAASALRHWHEEEDEFVFVLSGEITLVDENGPHVLTAGDYAGFPAGRANAHHLINHSDAPASFLAVGTRKAGRERIHYPDDPLGTQVVVRDGAGRRIEP
jgi:uncharacterized cupin superfamily protein